MMLYLISAAVLLTAAAAQQYTTPVPILKQINRHNEDGSYSYGYEAADGSFKIESKYPNGEVYGKYGYLDDTGKLREIEYGASRRGFEPAGNEINVPPPTLVNNYVQQRPLAPNEEDDGQYREDPSVYYKNEPSSRSNTQHYTQAYKPTYQQPSYQPSAYKQPTYQQPTYQESAYQEPAYQEPAYQEPTYQPAYRPQPTYRHSFASSQPQQPRYTNQYSGNPATNVDYNSGSYSVQY